MTKSILYYTDSRLAGLRTKGWQNEEIEPWAQRQLIKSGLPIVNVSLKPMNFGNNIVLDLEPSIVTMTKQILVGLETIDTDVVFFCEHDVLYPVCHFELEPADKDTFYYNVNSWKWDYNTTRVVYYDDMVGLYGLCGYREKLLEHYKKKVTLIYERGYDKIPVSRNPLWARTIGYEPGKPVRHGGVADEKVELWRSKEPTINIRHRRTTTPTKMNFEDFIRKPTGWKESTIDQIWKED